ncbi:MULTISPECIES: metal-dependent transcriptional regulator [unclassified Oceanispirochaeta]|uniref:metal-dependent transcriptional regulator n=1 Tax=unclassified Oceanispirochaeta TaxID=2635722 RepID=UPI000E091922|nr:MULTISPECIES: metal-dependent transcriptional regulator [unclassified Oceanispirochaeta]MBF9017085.1 metal-dependent transcriptional regulator [Oceanispirochaeta sp. M2]NPD73534.1 metal-dependent transcriptional regulator [Oceanispirochaeta sp. M1]RDG30822.1 metal-dependent transcriptional regulator [Oceanispirochaeta sp. M1]
MDKNIKLTPSLEDYLEAILQLEEKNRVARVKDIAEKLSVQMPSVTGALKNLKSKGMIEYEKNSFINLTDQGKVLAKAVLKKHTILLRFLEQTLFLAPEKAAAEACRIEHSIDQETAKRLENLSSYLTKNFSDKDLEKIILG